MTESAQGVGDDINRRQFLKKVGLAGVGAGAGIVEARTGFFRSILKSVAEFLNRPTQDQIDAAAAFNDPKIPKHNFIVRDDPEIRDNDGLNVRKNPSIPFDPKSEPPNKIGKLKIGEEVVGIPWQGVNTDDLNRRKDLSWVAFKDNEGRVGFVGRKYLEENVQNSQVVNASK